jgi:hypothetical protein
MMTCANCGAALTLADPGRRVVSATNVLERMTVDELGRETWIAEEVETSVAVSCFGCAYCVMGPAEKAIRGRPEDAIRGNRAIPGSPLFLEINSDLEALGIPWGALEIPLRWFVFAESKRDRDNKQQPDYMPSRWLNERHLTQHGPNLPATAREQRREEKPEKRAARNAARELVALFTLYPPEGVTPITLSKKWTRIDAKIPTKALQLTAKIIEARCPGIIPDNPDRPHDWAYMAKTIHRKLTYKPRGKIVKSIR